MKKAYYVDKTQVHFAAHPTSHTVHCIYHGHRLCDSAPAADYDPVIDHTQRDTCPTCIERVNTAIQDTRGAHYGS